MNFLKPAILLITFCLAQFVCARFADAAITEDLFDRLAAVSTIDIEVPKYELTIHSISFKGKKFLSGAEQTISYILKNKAKQQKSDFIIELYLSEDQEYQKGQDLLLGATFLTEIITPSSKVGKTMTVTIPEAVNITSSYNILSVVIEQGIKFDESVSLNVNSSANRYKFSKPRYPDLKYGFFTFLSSMNIVEQGQVKSIEYFFSNIGDEKAISPEVEFFLSADTNLGIEDYSIGRFKTNSNLKRNSSTGCLNASVTIPNKIPDGAYNIITKLDPDDKIQESSEINNVKVGGSLIVRTLSASENVMNVALHGENSFDSPQDISSVKNSSVILQIPYATIQSMYAEDEEGAKRSVKYWDSNSKAELDLGILPKGAYSLNIMLYTGELVQVKGLKK
ncbi:CARDB domain-containing protein [Reichenbachiella versicolor]|uniref:CARDB domain-containing protein n=1 Tax=Reichenbachiella versicolor TaxID=1821036 RepID=UPI000D6E3A8F|nr:CARDB domain-containing protein [Reichenbachiella versicolor]